MSAGNSFTLTEGTGNPEQVAGLHASANFLPLLGFTPQRGRQFTAGEDKENGPAVVMISHQLWQNRFNADTNIIGRVLQIDGLPREVVGVLPRTLPPPFNTIEIIVPRPQELPYITAEQRPNVIVHQGIARLAPGVGLEQANRRLQEMVAQFKVAHPNHIDSANQNELKTLTQQVLGNLGRTFWTLAGAVAAVLLIACANIANLFLARVSARQKEIAVRISLGARRIEIVRQFLAESLVFSACAGALGVIIAWWSLRGIQLLAGPQLPRADEIALDPVVLGFALLVALGAGVLIGLYPALQASRTDVQGVLKDTSRGAGGGKAAKAFRHFLVVAQVALSLTLLICAGLLVRSFSKLQHAALGFSTAGRAFGSINLPATKYHTPELSREFYRQLQARLDEAPELAAGGAIFGLPLSDVFSISPYAIQGRPIPAVHERPLAVLRFVTGGYFRAMSVQLREGRFLNEDDRFGGESVAVINESFAKKLFPHESAINHAFLTGRQADTAVRIVGVIRDVKASGLAVPPPDEIYYPRDQRGGEYMVVVGHAKPGLSASAVIPVLRRIVAQIDPNLALADARTLDQLVSESLGVQRVTTTLLICFASVAALLAAVGVYSVMAYSVTQRTGEIGVRLALGASTAHILGLVLRAGGLQVAAGLALGLIGALGGSRLLQEMLYEVKPFDPFVFAAVVVSFTGVAALACLIPAQRATRVDPMEALRSE